MLFAGLISAYLILRAGNEVWPPPFQPRLPVLLTGINTLFLAGSGTFIYRAVRAIRAGVLESMKKYLSLTVLFGGVFLFLQGSEWARLIGYGLTASSSLYGATFYTFIGVHGIHVVAGLVVLLFVLKHALGGAYSVDQHAGVVVCGLYWCFVVGVWPILYILVYMI
jgi:heme/copper-type cytochrome/quinol oxidase subunit 3